MLEEMSLTDLGVIAGARVRLGPGLTVLTGETGAGKTMVLTGLGLLLGGRADPGAVRLGADRASVEGRVVLPAGSPALARAAEAGAELDDDGSLLLARTVAAADGDARSRAYLGGRAVPSAVLAELADHLVTVHGQSDQNRLRSAAAQRDALDAHAGPEHATVLADYRQAWARRREVAAELADLRDHADELAREAETLRAGLADVERVAPQPGEDVALDTEISRLTNVEDLRAAAAGAYAALAGGDDPDAPPGATLAVDSARRALAAVADHDAALAALADRAAEVGYLLADVVADLAGYVDGLQADPARLDAAQTRRSELTGLTRVHGGDLAAVLAWADAAGRRLLDLDGSDDRVTELTDRLAELDERLAGLAQRVTAGRRAAADALAAAVTAELAGLAMPDARLQVVVQPADEPGAHGADRVELLLVAHAGAPARPLARGASGGELSRVMLAVEVVLATADPTRVPPTFVFDEVDAGVGGAAAVEVGRRLAALARDAQVLVVTHLAQVAAFADHHLVVAKSRDDVVTVADVRPVEGADRVRELARMLSGQADSDTARAHAAELLELAGVGR